MSESPNGKTPPTFEGSLAELQQIVQDLEEGKLGLEVSLSRFEEGIRLLRNCYQILEAAEQKIEILTGVDEAGTPVTAPFDASATFEGGDKPVKRPGRRRGTAKSDPAAEEVPPRAESTERDERGLF
jgi:exodeoxyribonuclease VII small subunit